MLDHSGKFKTFPLFSTLKFDSGIENIFVARYLNDIALSVSEPGTEDEFILFPQLAHDHITRQIKNTDKNEEYLINLYSVNSELIQSFKSTGIMTRVDISYLNSGVYYMNVSNWKHYKCMEKCLLRFINKNMCE